MYPRIPSQRPLSEDDLRSEMAVHGIECVPVDYFHWNGFRYSTLKDAVAAARRTHAGPALG